MSIYSDYNYNLNTVNKDIKLSYDNLAIKNAIRNILTIRKGTLVGNPEFGTTLENQLFEIMDELTYSTIEEIIYDDIERWEPRIRIISVDVTGDLDNQQIIAELNYEIIKTSEINSFKLTLN